MEEVKVESKQVADLEDLVNNLKVIMGSFEKMKTQLYSQAQSVLDVQNIVIMDRRIIETLVNRVEQLERKLENGGMFQ